MRIVNDLQKKNVYDDASLSVNGSVNLLFSALEPAPIILNSPLD
jgi:hypothetical protein